MRNPCLILGAWNPSPRGRPAPIAVGKPIGGNMDWRYGVRESVHEVAARGSPGRCRHGSPTTRRHRRGGVRRPRRRPRARQAAGRGHARRPPELHHVPAAALPGGHGRPERRRRRPPDPGPVPPPAQPARRTGRGGGRRLGRPSRPPRRRARPCPFDHLVLAVGAVATWFGVPGAEQHATPLYTLDDAVRVRNHVLERFEAADADPDAHRRRRAQLRRRRRRADRRRDRRGAGRAVQRRVPAGLPDARRRTGPGRAGRDA